MSDAGLPTRSPPERRGRRWVFLGLLVLLPFGLLAGLYAYLLLSADWELRQALAEADRLEPDGWRLQQLVEQRSAPPEGKNSAPQVLAARALFTTAWGRAPAFRGLFEEHPPENQLNEPQLAALRAELAKASAALPLARQLADMPRGRHDFSCSPDFIGTFYHHAQQTREVVTLLHYDTMLRAQEGDADGAVQSVRAALNAARSLSDEPFPLSQLVRMGCRAVAVAALERALAQGEPSADALAPLQQALEEDEPDDLLLLLMRGTRAGSHAMLEAGVSPTELRSLALGIHEGISPAERLALYVPGNTIGQRAALLRHLNQVVEAAKLPEGRQQAPLARLEEEARRGPQFVRLLAPAVANLRAQCRRSHAQLRCAIVGVAAERYRRQHGRWPESVEALVAAGLLKEVPADPYDGAPLRFRRLADGVVVYAVGSDGKDNGGTLNRKDPVADGSDLGFRLWDVAQRRQPPLPPRPDESEEPLP